jgi:hypothetical protein
LNAQPQATFRGCGRRASLLAIFFAAVPHEAEGGTAALKQLQSLPATPPEDSSPALQIDAQAGVVLRAIETIRQEFEPTTWQAFWLTAIEGCSPDAGGRTASRRAVIQRAYRVPAAA